ncbi:MAG: hypothetical protein LBD29_10155 [Treponema sp.]|jgi:hypothetical protein|nr:hypothetical protein [Treponema sp.]
MTVLDKSLERSRNIEEQFGAINEFVQGLIAENEWLRGSPATSRDRGT